MSYPCNFELQAMGFFKHVRPGGGYVPNFQLFQKGDVNGENEQKIYTFLKNSCPPVVETFGDTAKLFWSPLKIHDIKWNFEKFLVNPQGNMLISADSTIALISTRWNQYVLGNHFSNF
uniref:glutathione peroxidase n=1 Tax=Naja naja TaxID=35670 RepID=A0A8C6XV67_NAJNA